MERTPELHNDYLELIEVGGSKHSITYGINNHSPLIDLFGFNITACLPFVIMHTILRVLHLYISRQYFATS